MSDAIEETTAGLDWITATLPRDADGDAIWLHRCLECLDTIEADGYMMEMRCLNGYEGVMVGGSFCGSRQDGHMVQFSGRYAHKFYGTVYRPDVHISRLDLQVTVKFVNMPMDIARRGYGDAIEENKTLPVARRRKIFIIVGSDGGDTLYVGSTSSDARGRLYNKEVQSEDPLYTKTWRYEVTLRNDMAMRCIGSLAARSTNLVVFCSRFVAQWYQARGIKTPWDVPDLDIPLPPKQTLPTDIESKLNWLRHQVAPTIRYLIDRGLYDRVATALGWPSAETSPPQEQLE
jgi:hypothetical protein